MNWKKIFWLAAKTFLQACVGYIGASGVTDNQNTKIVLAGAFACGMSAVMNISWDELENGKKAESEEKADE